MGLSTCRLMFYGIFLILAFGLSGCSEEYRAKKRIEQLEESLKSANEEYKKAERSYDSAFARFYRNQTTISNARNQREFDRIAADGGLGTSEQLRVIKREIDAPGYQQQQADSVRRAEQSSDYLTRQIEDERLNLQQKKDALAKAESALAEGKRELARIRDL